MKADPSREMFFECQTCGDIPGNNVFFCPECDTVAEQECCSKIDDGIKVGKLISHLTEFKKKYGDVFVDVITEIDAQHEQPCGGIALSPREKRIKILPVGF